MARSRVNAYPTEQEMRPDESVAEARARWREQQDQRIGSTADQREGKDPNYVPGVGRMAKGNFTTFGGGLTDETDWRARFRDSKASPVAAYERPTQSGEPMTGNAPPAAPRLSAYDLGRELGNRTPGANPSGFDYTGMSHVPADPRLEPSTPIYDPAHDMRTQRQGNRIISPYGEASVTHVAAPQGWQQAIVKQYPQIGVAGSPENAAFLKEYAQHQAPERAMESAHAAMRGVAAGQQAQQLASTAPAAGRSSGDTSVLNPSATPQGGPAASGAPLPDLGTIPPIPDTRLSLRVASPNPTQSSPGNAPSSAPQSAPPPQDQNSFFHPQVQTPAEADKPFAGARQLWNWFHRNDAPTPAGFTPGFAGYNPKTPPGALPSRRIKASDIYPTEAGNAALKPPF